MVEGIGRIDGLIEPSKVVDIISIVCGTSGGGRGKQPIKEDVFRRPVPILTYELRMPPIRGTVLLGNMA